MTNDIRIELNVPAPTSPRKKRDAKYPGLLQTIEDQALEATLADDGCSSWARIEAHPVVAKRLRRWISYINSKDFRDSERHVSTKFEGKYIYFRVAKRRGRS